MRRGRYGEGEEGVVTEVGHQGRDELNRGEEGDIIEDSEKGAAEASELRREEFSWWGGVMGVPGEQRRFGDCHQRRFGGCHHEEVW